MGQRKEDQGRPVTTSANEYSNRDQIINGKHTTGTVQHMAVVPEAAQDASKSATVVRSGSAVEVCVSERIGWGMVRIFGWTYEPRS
jgi:hypothetical protein